MQTIFSRNLEKNLKTLQERLHLDVNDDVVVRRFSALGQECALVYVEGLSDGEQMAQHILRPMMNSPLSLTAEAPPSRRCRTCSPCRRRKAGRKFRGRWMICSGACAFY